jgi:hypothetical protein
MSVSFVELLGSMPLSDIGFAGIVTLAIVLILRGQLVPKSTVDEMRKDRDAIIASKSEEADNWREAYKVSEEARAVSTDADRELLELGRTTVHLLQSIHERAQEAQS